MVSRYQVNLYSDNKESSVERETLVSLWRRGDLIRAERTPDVLTGTSISA
jgi:hypothetical protein